MSNFTCTAMGLAIIAVAVGIVVSIRLAYVKWSSARAILQVVGIVLMWTFNVAAILAVSWEIGWGVCHFILHDR